MSKFRWDWTSFIIGAAVGALLVGALGNAVF
jgi:hypothetical protein